MPRKGAFYKKHYACFNCRKTFKKNIFIEEEIEEVKCPQCNKKMFNMGLDFKAPKKKDKKAWEFIELLQKVGVLFIPYEYRDFGIIPKDKKEFLELLFSIQKRYIKNYQEEMRKNYLNSQKEFQKKYKDYWKEKLEELSVKINFVKKY